MSLEVRDGGNTREKAKASDGMRRRQLGPGGGCRAISRDVFSAGAARHRERRTRTDSMGPAARSVAGQGHTEERTEVSGDTRWGGHSS